MIRSTLRRTEKASAPSLEIIAVTVFDFLFNELEKITNEAGTLLTAENLKK